MWFFIDCEMGVRRTLRATSASKLPILTTRFDRFPTHASGLVDGSGKGKPRSYAACRYGEGSFGGVD